MSTVRSKGKLGRWLLLSALLVLVLVVTVVGFFNAHYDRDVHEADPVLATKGRIEKPEGYPILHLEGSAYAMGYQHGVLLKNEIAAFETEAYAYVEKMLAKQWGIPVFVARLIMRPLLYREAFEYLDTIPVEYLDEMEGIADGAGVAFADVLLMTCFWDMFYTHACSEFVLRSPDGRMFHGYNYDIVDPGHSFIQKYMLVIFYQPDEGIPFSMVNWVGNVGANTGMNDAGITVAWDNTLLRDTSILDDVEVPVRPFMITLRHLLQYATNLGEAREIAEEWPRSSGDIILIASDEEKSALALELAGKQSAVRPLEGEFLFSANHFVALDTYDWKGDERTALYREKLSVVASQPANPEMCAKILRTEGICRKRTAMSVIYDLTDGRFWVSASILPAPMQTYFAYDQASRGPAPSRARVDALR
jgi:hypothetical protein